MDFVFVFFGLYAWFNLKTTELHAYKCFASNAFKNFMQFNRFTNFDFEVCLLHNLQVNTNLESIQNRSQSTSHFVYFLVV